MSIAIKINDEYLDLFDNTSVQIEADSPLFGDNYIPGTKVYSHRIRKSRTNQRLLGIPELLANQEKFPVYENAQYFIKNILWKTGSIKIREANNIDSYSISFHSDAGEAQLKIKDLSIRDLDLGSDPVNLVQGNIYPAQKHVFFPVKNEIFYDEKNPDYGGYINYYHGGQFVNNGTGSSTHTRIAFPFLLHILNKVFQQLGYFGMTGDWVTDPDIRRVVIFNTHALDQLNGSNTNIFQSTVNYADVMPDISVGAFLIRVKQFFGISFIFNPITKYVKIVRLDDVINDLGYIDFTTKSARGFLKSENPTGGFSLKMLADSKDETFETLDPAWLEYKVNGGGDPLEVQASPLFVVSDADTINARTWTIPVIKQKGNSPEFELGQDNGFNLRFLMYNGMQADSQSNNFPQGHYMTSGLSLRWDGANGLYERNYKSWLDFRINTTPVERDIRLNIIDIHNFDFTKKMMIDYIKYLPVTYKVSVNFKTGIAAANFDLMKVNL